MKFEKNTFEPNKEQLNSEPISDKEKNLISMSTELKKEMKTFSENMDIGKTYKRFLPGLKITKENENIIIELD